MALLPPLSAIDNCLIQLFAPAAGGGTAFWDTAIWDNAAATWQGPGWQDITPQSLNAQITWGTDDNQGALSLSAAGSWQVATYDPQRLLDPANYNSPYVSVLKPGGQVRIIFRDNSSADHVVRTGFIDEIGYDIYTNTGDIRCTDGISLLVKAKVPEGLTDKAPLTLRAFSRFMLAQGQVAYITVESDPVAPDYDPPVGAALDFEASVWQQITAAALDALNAVWLDADGILRFRYFGKPHVSGVDIGTGGIPVETVASQLSMEGVFNHARAVYYSYDAPISEAKKQSSIDAYGDLLIARDRPHANPGEWVDQILQDRGAAAVRYETGTLRPRTEAELLAILSLGMGDQVGLHVHNRGTPIDRTVTVLGGSIEANVESGWSGHLITYEPASPWWNKDADRVYQARYYGVASTEFVRISGVWSSKSELADQVVYGSPYNSATTEEHTLAIDFQNINFTGMSTIWDAKLRLYLPFHTDTQVDSAPRLNELDWLRARWITADWDAYTTTPPATNTSQDTWQARGELGRWMEMDIRGIVGRWQANVSPQYGIYLLPEPERPAELQHAIISGAKSINAPYILLSYKR